MAARKKSKKAGASAKRSAAAGKKKPAADAPLAERIQAMEDLSEAGYLLADEFAVNWDVRPGRTEYSTVLREAWETIWERGGKVKQVVRLLDQAADGSKYDMDDDFVAIRVTPKHVVQVGKRLCTAFVTLSAVQRRYWRIKPKLKRPMRLGFLSAARAPASTSAALRRWRTEQTKRHDALEDAYRELYLEILERIQGAAVLLDAHRGALLAFFEAIRLAEQSRIQDVIAALPRGDARRTSARSALKRLHVGSRRLNHFREAPSQLFPTWKQDWLLPRQALLEMLDG